VRKHRQAIVAVCRRFVLWLVVSAGVTVLAGVAFAEWKGRSIEGNVKASFFVVGGLIFVGAAVSGGGARGRRATVFSGREDGAPQEMPFIGVLIGLALVGIGVLMVVL
jgi:hypothetical protein